MTEGSAEYQREGKNHGSSDFWSGRRARPLRRNPVRLGKLNRRVLLGVDARTGQAINDRSGAAGTQPLCGPSGSRKPCRLQRLVPSFDGRNCRGDETAGLASSGVPTGRGTSITSRLWVGYTTRCPLSRISRLGQDVWPTRTLVQYPQRQVAVGGKSPSSPLCSHVRRAVVWTVVATTTVSSYTRQVEALPSCHAPCPVAVLPLQGWFQAGLAFIDRSISF
jgi:hypothetical protein